MITPWRGVMPLRLGARGRFSQEGGFAFRQKTRIESNRHCAVRRSHESQSDGQINIFVCIPRCPTEMATNCNFHDIIEIWICEFEYSQENIEIWICKSQCSHENIENWISKFQDSHENIEIWICKCQYSHENIEK